MPYMAVVVVAVAFGLAAMDVLADAARIAVAADKGPFDPSLYVTYGWVVGLSLLGGVASFYAKVKSGQARPFNLTELIGELVTSAVAGLVTFMLCKWAKVDDWLMAALVAISGHMGSRAIFMLERHFERWVERTFGQGGAQSADRGEGKKAG